MKKALIAALLLGLGIPAKAIQDAGLPGSYLNYAGSPRVAGMGRAFVGLAEGTDAITWNPAGLGLLKPNMLGVSYMQTAENAALDEISYAQPIYRYGALGVDYIRLDSGSLPQTNEFNQQVGNFSDVQQTFMAAYGIRPMPSLAFGGTFKFAQQSLAGTSASGWGLDAGAMAFLSHGLRVGMRIQNAIAPSFKYATGTDDFPRVVTTGLAESLMRDRLIFTLDGDRSLDGGSGMSLRTGMEMTLMQMASFRAGFDFSAKEFTVGLGLRFGRQSIDYVNGSGQPGSENHFGYSYAFGGYDISAHARPEVFSPTGINKMTNIDIQVNHTRKIYSWELQIINQSHDLVRDIRGNGQPPARLEWDGANQAGTMMPAGPYVYRLTVVDTSGAKETTPDQTVRLDYGTPMDKISLESL